MKFNVQNTENKNIKIYDNMGREIKFVSAYDTETCEITFMPTFVRGEGKFGAYTEITDDGNIETKKITTIWKGTYAEINGVRFSDIVCGAV